MASISYGTSPPVGGMLGTTRPSPVARKSSFAGGFPGGVGGMMPSSTPPSTVGFHVTNSNVAATPPTTSPSPASTLLSPHGSEDGKTNHRASTNPRAIPHTGPGSGNSRSSSFSSTTGGGSHSLLASALSSSVSATPTSSLGGGSSSSYMMTTGDGEDLVVYLPNAGRPRSNSSTRRVSHQHVDGETLSRPRSHSSGSNASNGGSRPTSGLVRVKQNHSSPPVTSKPASEVVGFALNSQTGSFDAVGAKPAVPALGGNAAPTSLLGAQLKSSSPQSDNRTQADITESSMVYQVEERITLGGEATTLDNMHYAEDDMFAEAQIAHSVFGSPVVKRAYRVAKQAHQGQLRSNGESVLSHCLATAIILAECGLDASVLAAGLLHDTLDNSMMTETELRSLFNDEVTDMVVGLSKMTLVSKMNRESKASGYELSGDEVQDLRTMFLAMTDARMVVVKLAERVNNMRTIDGLDPEKQVIVAGETLEVFAGLANRLGLWSLKSELEDLCFAQLNPDEYTVLAEGLEDHVERAIIMERIDEAQNALLGAGISSADITGRPKNLYGIYKKMRAKGLTYDEICDVRAMRIIVETEEECYRALELVHNMWTPMENKMKDYVKNPKPNSYQSLHTVVFDNEGRPFEVQIRTADMHETAEYGVAAHWRYKENVMGSSKFVEEQIAWARYMLSWQGEISDSKLRAEGCSLRLPKSFPQHEPSCPAASFTGKGAMPRCTCSPLSGGPFQLPDDSADEDLGPLYVVVLEDSALAVKEMKGGSSLSDLLAEPALAEKVSSGSVCVMVNQEPVELGWGDEADKLKLKMGDRIEIMYVAGADRILDLSPAAVERTREKLMATMERDLDNFERTGSWDKLNDSYLGGSSGSAGRQSRLRGSKELQLK